jgi:hypothetical protein
MRGSVADTRLLVRMSGRMYSRIPVIGDVTGRFFGVGFCQCAKVCKSVHFFWLGLARSRRQSHVRGSDALRPSHGEAATKAFRRGRSEEGAHWKCRNISASSSKAAGVPVRIGAKLTIRGSANAGTKLELIVPGHVVFSRTRIAAGKTV